METNTMPMYSDPYSDDWTDEQYKYWLDLNAAWGEYCNSWDRLWYDAAPIPFGAGVRLIRDAIRREYGVTVRLSLVTKFVRSINDRGGIVPDS